VTSGASKSQASLNPSGSRDFKNTVHAVVNNPSKSSQSQTRSMPSIGTGAGQVFTDVGLYKGVVVSIKHIKKDHIQVTRQVLVELNEVCPQGCGLGRYVSVSRRFQDV